MARLLAVSATDVGLVRPSNEDRALVGNDLIAVADGMGGHVGGEVAAAIAIDALNKSFARDRTAAGLVLAASAANRAVINEAEQNRALRGMGTTLTAAGLVGDPGHEEVVVVNVGDSRAYLYESGELVRLTDDHSLAEEMVRSGELTAEQAEIHPHRHILTRALGLDPTTEVDSWIIGPRPTMRFLICSDGLTNECPDEEIARILRIHPEREEAANALVAAAKDHGGSDNITVVIADIADIAVSDQAPRAGSVTRSQHASRNEQARARDERRVKRTRERMFTFRATLFALLFILVVAGSFGAIDWFNQSSYFLQLRGNHIVVYEGRPGGLLFFKPRLVKTTDVTSNDVLSTNLARLRAGIIEPSYADALSIVRSLKNEKAILGIPTPSSTQATSKSSAPPTSNKAGRT